MTQEINVGMGASSSCPVRKPSVSETNRKLQPPTVGTISICQGLGASIEYRAAYSGGSGKLYLNQDSGIRELDARTGEALGAIDTAELDDLEAMADGTVSVLSAGSRVLRLKGCTIDGPAVTGGTACGAPLYDLARAKEKRPRTFFSGVVRKRHEMQSVVRLEKARIEVTVDARDRRYTVEAAIALRSIGLRLVSGLALTGDIGATHGDHTGTDTVLRSYGNNQATGMIAHEFFELKRQPKNWRKLVFECNPPRLQSNFPRP